MSQQYGSAWHPSQKPAPSTTGWSVVWALVPLFTCGLGTPFIMGYAARRLRSVPLVFATVLYALGIGVFLIEVQIYGDTDLVPAWLDAMTTVGLLGSWFGGLGHALIIRGSVFREQPSFTGAPYHPPVAPPPHPHAHTAAPVAPTAPPYGRPAYPPHPAPPHHSPAPGPYTAAPPSGPRHTPHTQHTLYSPQSSNANVNRTFASSDRSPEWIGPYRVIDTLGQGGQGTVHLALSPQGRKVAIKVLHERFTGNQAARDRFLREVEATRRVATFSTARVLDVNINDDQAYVVSEYVDGMSLEQLVRDQGPRGEDGLTRLALATAGALAAIHKAGVVHRDFKPANVLIGSDGPRVIDFGIARALDQVTVTSSVMGTPAYMSPEQLAGGHVGPETDVFSWASTMIYAASGRTAFGSDTIPAILNRVINHQPDLSVLPASLRPLAAACLEKNPANRPSAADIMLRIVQ
ncbi:serine/threonine-protein kinase [Planomonospora sp. ID82291]|uniref:serine/threonine-protein kinase n=1 Tax=Planomonospora sp. ID82291 TaxID=2738136 RepID=UPI0018C4353A|nr:serine/threonine-protein kinase [Planomonospora sp. ID82291]MBG0813874.1 serine/threonine protein kinase [Planomonospora sp. ID82291]